MSAVTSRHSAPTGVLEAPLTMPTDAAVHGMWFSDRRMLLEVIFTGRVARIFMRRNAVFGRPFTSGPHSWSVLADPFGEAYAAAHKDDKLHYFVGAGAIYGATYSYAMCYWEEMHWIRTKSIHAAEFFHGMLEIVDKDTPVTLFVGEDSQRDIALRVARFLPKVCENYTVIDSRDYDLPGIDEKYRGYVSHLVTHAVTNRIDAHLEAQTGHDMTIRRYYRKMDY